MLLFLKKSDKRKSKRCMVDDERRCKDFILL